LVDQKKHPIGVIWEEKVCVLERASDRKWLKPLTFRTTTSTAPR
jgi:hypothetical protein